MKTQAERRLGWGLAALLMTLVWGAATPATSHAAPMYSITDVGLPSAVGAPTADPSFDDQMVISNSGQISDAGSWWLRQVLTSGIYTVDNMNPAGALSGNMGYIPTIRWTGVGGAPAPQLL